MNSEQFKIQYMHTFADILTVAEVSKHMYKKGEIDTAIYNKEINEYKKELLEVGTQFADELKNKKQSQQVEKFLTKAEKADWKKIPELEKLILFYNEKTHAMKMSIR